MCFNVDTNKILLCEFLPFLNSSSKSNTSFLPPAIESLPPFVV